MSTIYNRLGYSIKVMLSGSLNGAIFICILLAIIVSHLEWVGFDQPNLHIILILMLLFMPVIATVIFANSFAEELEEQLLCLLYAYPYKMLYVILERILFCFIFLLISFATILWMGQLGGVDLSWNDVMYAAWRILPGTLFLGAFKFTC